MPKRMISPELVDSDLFIGMPATARLLYYDLNVRADDDGFVGSPKKIMEFVRASEDDLRILISRGFIITFETGICVIRHWRIHNYIRPDRYHPTIYQDELKLLQIHNKIYEKGDVIPLVGQLTSKLDTESRLDKNSNNNSNNIEEDKTIYEIIETEFGRPISPMECELIHSWDYPIEILKRAVQEAVTSANFSMKYIDRIIYNWKQANVRSLQDVEEYIRKFKDKKQKKGNLPASESGADYYEVL